MRQLFIIVKYKLWRGLKGVLSVRLSSITKNVATIVVLGGFSIGMFFFAQLVTSYLINEAKIGLFLFHRFVSMVLFVFFLAINLGNLVVAYSTLYKSEEVIFLLTQPISFEKIFIIKFLDNFFHSSSTLFLIGVSVLAGYGSVFQLPWSYYLIILLGLIFPFMILAAALAVIMLLGLMKLAAKISLRRLIGGLLLIYLATLIAFFQITNPIHMTEQVMKFYPDVNQYFSQFDPAIVAYLPNHWVADSLFFLVRGELARAIPYVEVLLLAMVGSLIICALLAFWLYYPTWLTSRELKWERGKQKRQPVSFLDFQANSPLGVQTEVLLKKDFWQFFREPSQWLHLVIMIFLVLVFIVSVASARVRMSDPFLQTVSYSLIMTFNGFLIASIALRFVFPMISIEGQSFWSILSSPVQPKKVYWLKFIVSFTFVFIVAIALSVFSNYSLLRFGPLLATALVSSFSLSLGLVTLNLASGSYFVNYREKNAIRVASSPAASLTFLLSLSFLSLVVMTLFIPLHQYFEYLILGRSYLQGAMTAPLIVLVGISLVLAGTASHIGLRALRRDF